MLVDPEVALLSTVPPHLVDGKGNSFRSALIPFCAFDGNMSTLGQDIDGLDFPACNKFKPDIVDGRLCYTLELEKAHFEDKAKTAHGRGTGSSNRAMCGTPAQRPLASWAGPLVARTGPKHRKPAGSGPPWCSHLL